jgi:hypothetical protein
MTSDDAETLAFRDWAATSEDTGPAWAATSPVTQRSFRTPSLAGFLLVLVLGAGAGVWFLADASSGSGIATRHSGHAASASTGPSTLAQPSPVTPVPSAPAVPVHMAPSTSARAAAGAGAPPAPPGSQGGEPAGTTSAASTPRHSKGRMDVVHVPAPASAGTSRPSPRPHPAAPRPVPKRASNGGSSAQPPARSGNGVCAAGTQFGGWPANSPQARICRSVYGG